MPNQNAFLNKIRLKNHRVKQNIEKDLAKYQRFLDIEIGKKVR